MCVVIVTSTLNVGGCRKVFITITNINFPVRSEQFVKVVNQCLVPQTSNLSKPRKVLEHYFQ